MKIVDKQLKAKWSETYEAAIEREKSLAWCYHCDVGFTVYPKDVHKSRHVFRAKTFCPICGGSCTVVPYTPRYRIRHMAAAASPLTSILLVIAAVLLFLVYMAVQVTLLESNLYLGLAMGIIPFALIGLFFKYWDPNNEWPKDENGNFDRERVVKALETKEGYVGTVQGVGGRATIHRSGARSDSAKRG